MKISFNWLKDYINTDLDSKEVSEILTNIGLEVEGMEAFQSVKGGLKDLVIGEVITCEKHPNADKLTVTTVDIGKEELLNIICGAPNVKAGQKVVVAPVGTSLFKGEESFKLKKAKIRGIVSEGMICAEDEIGISTSHEGIIELDINAEVGSLVKDYYNLETDIIFEIDLTPNRIDGASHYGTARDLAAYLQQYQKVILKKPSVEHFKIDNNIIIIDVVIENTEACPRYSGITISGIKVSPSPQWLQNKLKSIDLHPVNNIVDITNFVLHETGQPLHAFDVDKITGKKIIVKTLPEGSKFVTLDEIERELSSQDLMICNAEKGMCIAGVFGGIDSGVTESTRDIFLESAFFNPVFIRKTSKYHTLITDASFRFERGTDPNNTVYALKRAALLIKEIAGGNISSEIADIYPFPIDHFKVEVFFENVKRLIGKDIGKDKIISILNSLEIKTLEQTPEKLLVAVPTYRVDVQREADVIEEILRIYGYNNIEISENFTSNISYSQKPDKEKIINFISDHLSNNGFNEIMSNSLTKSAYYEKLKTFSKDQVVPILNPLSAELNGMRQTILLGGLEAISYNINRKNPDIKLYEFGNCYFYNKNSSHSDPLKKYIEEQHLVLFLSGRKNEVNWISKSEPTNFYQLKSYVEMVINRLGLEITKMESNEISSDIFSEGISLHVYLNMGLSNYSKDRELVKIVDFGKINTDLLKEFDIKADVFFADFNWDNVNLLLKNHKIIFTEIPKYPEVKRDLALLLDKNIHFEQIRKLAFQTEKKFLRKFSLFDVYEENKIGKDKKSYAVSFILQDKKGTLTDKQIDKIMKKFIMSFEKNLGAQIR